MTVEDRLDAALIDYSDLQIVRIDGYDDCVVGLSEDDRLVYDYELLVQQTMHDCDCDYTEAVDYVEFNIISALHGSCMPVVMHRI